MRHLAAAVRERTGATGPRRSLVLVAAMLAISTPAFSDPNDTEGRIVAVGDVHGDLEGFRSILRASGLLDDSDNWSGGATTLVQTGDLVERGTKVRQVLDLMMSLQEQAPRAGGKVVAILGNHEVNNLLAYLDYNSTPPQVYAEIFAGFTDDRSEDRRKQAYKQWARWRHSYPRCGKVSKQEWENDHPLGYVEYFEAFGPEGTYGRWLRSWPSMARIGSTLFAHGGPSPWLASQGFDSVYAANRAVSREIEAFDRARDYLVSKGIILPFFTLSEIYCAVTEALAPGPSKFGPLLSDKERSRILEIRRSLPNVDHSITLRPEGPLWYRGFARLGEREGAQIIADLLATWKVENIVVAHTPQKGNVEKRFENVFLIDTGMVYGSKIGGRPSALEISGRRFTAVYDSEQIVLREPPATDDQVVLAALEKDRETDLAHRWLAADGEHLPFAKEEEILEFLATARVVSTEPIPTGSHKPSKLLLEQYGIKAHAIFRRFETEERIKRVSRGGVVPFFSDSHRNEVAAYELSRLLGMSNLSPAVRRTVGGKVGSVQLWVEHAMSEKERLEQGLSPPNQTAWRRQLADMRVFDNLIRNIDRTQGNVLIDPEWKIWLVDHTQSFGLDGTLPNAGHLTRCSRELWSRIRSLDKRAVRERLGSHLRNAEIEALLKRREKLIRAMEARIAELGEQQVLFSHEDALGPNEFGTVAFESLTLPAPAEEAPR
jgi:hypothetical protein